jgi:hypothetical protein
VPYIIVRYFCRGKVSELVAGKSGETILKIWQVKSGASIAHVSHPQTQRLDVVGLHVA